MSLPASGSTHGQNYAAIKSDEALYFGSIFSQKMDFLPDQFINKSLINPKKPSLFSTFFKTQTLSDFSPSTSPQQSAPKWSNLLWSGFAILSTLVTVGLFSFKKPRTAILDWFSNLKKRFRSQNSGNKHAQGSKRAKKNDNNASTSNNGRSGPENTSNESSPTGQATSHTKSVVPKIAELRPFNPDAIKNSKGKVRYFAYGSNMDSKQLDERLPGFDPHQQGQFVTAHGFKLNFVDREEIQDRKNRKKWGRGGVATIDKKPNSRVEGQLYELNLDDKEILARFEGVKKTKDGYYIGGYRPMNILVQQQDGTMVECVTYIRNHPHMDASLPPSKEYFKHITNWIEEAVRLGIPFSPDYIASIKPDSFTPQPSRRR